MMMIDTDFILELNILNLYIRTILNYIKILGENMFPSSKNSFKRTRIKPENSQAFHLAQSQRATTAKNELLYLTSLNERFYSTDAISYRTRRKPHQTVDSWHGEQSLSLKEPSPSKIQKVDQIAGINIPQIQIPRQNHPRHNNPRESQHKQLVRSADSTIFKKRESAPNNQLNKLRRSIIEINSNNFDVTPFSKSLNSSQKQLKKTSTMAKRKFKTLSAHSQNRHVIQKHKNSSKDFINSHILAGLPEEDKLGNTGVLGSSFKRRHQKKNNWHRGNKINSNLLRIEQFKASNSPLKKQIDKILYLLREQSKYGKVLSYE